MGDQSPPTSRLGLTPELTPAVPGAKRQLDSAEQAQDLQPAKKVCVLGHHCSTPKPSEKLLLCSPGAASLQESSYLVDYTGDNDLVASCASNYGDVAISLDTTQCLEESEPDDSLLELSDSDEGSSFSYTEEEIQEILADDCVESEQHLPRKSTPSQNVAGESGRDKSSCTGASVVSKDAGVESEMVEKPNEALPRESPSVSSEEFLSESAGVEEKCLQSAQVTRMLFDLDIQELLSLTPIDGDSVDEPLEDSSLKEAEREASEAIMNGCLEDDQTSGSRDPEGSSEELMATGQHSPGVDCLGKASFSSRDVPDLRGDGVQGSTSSSDLACGQSPAEECSAPKSGDRELSKAAKRWFSRRSDSSGDDEGESTDAEEPSNSSESSDTSESWIEQEETASGKKPGRVIAVPQEEGEGLKQWTCISEAELEQEEVCEHPHEENCNSYSRNDPRSNKKPPQGLHCG